MSLTENAKFDSMGRPASLARARTGHVFMSRDTHHVVEITWYRSHGTGHVAVTTWYSPDGVVLLDVDLVEDADLRRLHHVLLHLHGDVLRQHAL